jgi:nucleoside phosphorylase
VPESGRLGMARVAVLTIVNDEFDAVKRVYGLTKFSRGYAFADPKEGATDIVVYQSDDRFNLAASGSVTKIIRDYMPQFLLVVGIAGGVGAKGVTLGDVVVPRVVHYSELAKHVDGAIFWRYVPFDQPSAMILGAPGRDALREGNWTDRIDSVRPVDGVSTAIFGENIIAGDKIWGSLDDNTQKLILHRFEDAVAVETESAGVARAVFTARCELNHNLQYAVIRGISDLVDVPHNQVGRETWRPYAAAAAAAFSHEIAVRLLEDRSAEGLIAADLV